MDTSSLDLSKIVSVIMENPELISAIKKLASAGEKVDTDSTPNEISVAADDTSDVSEETYVGSDGDGASVETSAESDTVLTSASTYKGSAGSSTRRATLLKALKPYVSKERAKAIDTMMSFAEVFKLMREG